MTTIKVARTDVEVWYKSNAPELNLSQLAVEVIKTVPGTIQLQTAQVAVELVRRPSNIELQCAQFCIELLRPTAGYARLAAYLQAQASFVLADLTLPPPIPEPPPCDPCIPLYYRATVQIRPSITPAPDCDENECPVNDYRSK